VVLRQPKSNATKLAHHRSIIVLRTFVSDGRRLAVKEKFMKGLADWCKEILQPDFVFRAKDYGV